MELYRARQLVGRALGRRARDIPTEYGTPQLGPATGALGEVYHFEVQGAVSLMDRRSALDWIIAPRLRIVPGVVEVNTIGGEAKSLEITLDRGEARRRARRRARGALGLDRATTWRRAAPTWSTGASTSPCAVRPDQDRRRSGLGRGRNA